MKFLFYLVILVLVYKLNTALDPPYGQLKIQGTHVTNSKGVPVQLRGMSLFMSAVDPGPKFYNAETVKHIRDDWNSNIVRAAMWITGYGDIGYLLHPEVEYERMVTVINAAIEYGIYVIVDWHDYSAENHTDQAIKFFANIPHSFGSYPHIIYETYNEPIVNNWTVVKNYAKQVIPAIRANDPNNIIVVGTPVWSQSPDQAANDPLNFTNIAYTLHHYAANYKQSNRDKAAYAISKGLPLFVTEYGVADSSGNGSINYDEATLWWDFDDEHKLSYVNWAMDDKYEADSALISNTNPSQIGDPSRWTASGKLVNQKYQSTDQGVWNTTKSTSPIPTALPCRDWKMSYRLVLFDFNPNKCLRFSSGLNSFSGAVAQCTKLASGSTLLSIDHSFENLEYNEEAAIEIKSCNEVYIGLTKNNEIWSWLNGDNQTYRNWDVGFPDSNSNNTCSFSFTNSTKWQNGACTQKACFVCQLIVN